MSLVDACAGSSTKKFRNWRTLAAIVLMLMGSASVLWGTHHLLLTTEVPSCAIPVDEMQDVAPEVEVEGEQLAEADGEAGGEKDLTPVSTLDSGGFGQIRVEVAGAVNKPGLYWLSYESRVADLFKLAGGLSSDADLKKINQQFNLALKLKDEQRIVVPYQQEREMEEWLAEYCRLKGDQALAANQPGSGNSQESGSEEKDEIEGNEVGSVAPATECVSINYASNAQLQTLTGVGEKTAELIIEGRPYFKISELLEVKGIGDATLEKLESFICL